MFHLLLPVFITLPSPPAGVAQLRAEEPLPPRALARLGTPAFYHDGEVTAAAISPDGARIASASVAKVTRDESITTVCLWDTDTGRRLWTVPAGRHPITGLTFSPDGKRLAVIVA